MISPPTEESPHHHTRTKFTTTTGQSVELSRPELEVSVSFSITSQIRKRRPLRNTLIFFNGVVPCGSFTYTYYDEHFGTFLHIMVG